MGASLIVLEPLDLRSVPLVQERERERESVLNGRGDVLLHCPLREGVCVVLCMCG